MEAQAAVAKPEQKKVARLASRSCRGRRLESVDNMGSPWMTVEGGGCAWDPPSEEVML